MSRARILRIINISLLVMGVFCLYILFGQDPSVTSLKRPVIQPETDHHGRGLKNEQPTTAKLLSINPQPHVQVEDESKKASSSTKSLSLSSHKTLSSTTRESAIQKLDRRKMQQQQNKSSRKKLEKTIFSFADHKAGSKNSKPLKYGLNLTLTRLNMEFGSDDRVSVANTPNYLKPRFNLQTANKMEMVGNIPVGNIIPNHSARHILLLTTWRSGSTFLGDLLNHYKGVFYYFEPLHYYSKSKDKKIKPVQKRPDFLRSLLQCNFNKDNIGYLHHASKADNKFLFKNHNFRLWNTCHGLLPNDMMCFMPDYLNAVCPMFPIKLIKTVRLQMREVEPLLEDSSLGLKIVFLVRDPRGTYNSRSSGAISKWCVHDECANPAVGCENLLDNYEVALDVEKRFPGTVKLVRYEDLSMFTEDVTMDLLDFLGLPFTEELSSYIDTHTNKDQVKTVRNKWTHRVEKKKSPYSTSRNSTATAFAWRQKLSFDKIRNIQSSCKEPMQKLGYKLYSSHTDTDSEELPLVTNLDKIWPFTNS